MMELDYLNESMKRKTEKIQRMKIELDMFKKKPINIPIGLLMASLLYILFINQVYMNNVISFLDATNAAYYPLNLLEIIILVGIAPLYIIISFYFRKLNKLKKNYESLRIDIITQMEHKFCVHNEGCICKDSYIIDMDKKYGIDVVFK